MCGEHGLGLWGNECGCVGEWGRVTCSIMESVTSPDWHPATVFIYKCT